MQKKPSWKKKIVIKPVLVENCIVKQHSRAVKQLNLYKEVKCLEGKKL